MKILRSTDVRSALRARQRGFLLNPFSVVPSSPFRALLHFDGADAATSFPDASPLAWAVTPGGNVQVDTAQSVFGGASALFDGTTDYLTLGNGSLFDWGTISPATNITIDLRARLNSVTGTRQFAAHAVAGSGGDGKGGWSFFNNGGKLGLTCSKDNTSGTWFAFYQTNSAVMTTGVWYHVALVIAAGVPTLYLDGVAQAASYQVGSGWGSSLIGINTTRTDFAMRIGASFTDSSNPTPTGGLDGWIDEFAYRAAAVWTSNFTPPGSAYTV